MGKRIGNELHTYEIGHAKVSPNFMATIAILGTMDTKGEEHAFVAEQIRARGHNTLVIDVGALDPPKLRPDIAREEVARAAKSLLATLQ